VHQAEQRKESWPDFFATVPTIQAEPGFTEQTVAALDAGLEHGLNHGLEHGLSRGRLACNLCQIEHPEWPDLKRK
jgi:hypothetical protein